MKITGVALLFLCLALYAQTGGATFEAAAIRPHGGEVTFSADPALRGSFVRGTASTLLDMITMAYGVRPDQVSGGPEWIRKDRFDMEAKVSGDMPPSPDQVRTMMQNLLGERFKLQIQRKTNQVPIYALTVDRSGTKLKPGVPNTKPSGFVRATPDGLHMETNSGTMEKLAEQLSVTAGRPVIDRTALTGTFEYTLHWFPANRIPEPGSDEPSMFAALQEQLGLKLESTTGPQDVLVITSVEKPSEN